MKLQLFVIHNVPSNEYLVSAHNQTPEQAEQLVRAWNQQPVAGCSPLVIDHQKAHKTVDAESCRACREIVRRTSGLRASPEN